MFKPLHVIAASASLVLIASTASAACDPGKPGSELTAEEAEEVYTCLKDELRAGYMEGDKKWVPADFVRDYPNWTPVSRVPANPGFHGGRFLFTYVNEVGAEEYLKYAEERGDMPAGTKIAKESFGVNEEGKVEKGPLFLMQKVEEGVSPETNDWYYMVVAPNGQPQAVEVISACNECHQGNFGNRDGLGYPIEEARVAE